jgi:5-formyltetrahydrofolate cyclo-ligase
VPSIDKATLRTRMAMVRDLIEDRVLRSVQLWAALAEVPEFAKAECVMAFAGMRSEPDTDPLFARLAAEGRRLVLPRVESGRLAVVSAEGEMAVSRYGVREPVGPALDPAVVDFVVVPGLAFTPDGRRLGYGAGFYDRFLPTVNAFTAGVCFTEQLLDDLPCEPHDVRVQRVVSA